MKVLYAIVARRLIVENVTGVPSLVDVVEELTALGAPATGFPDDAHIDAQLSFVVLLGSESEETKSRGDIPARYWLDTPSGRKVDGPVTVNFSGSVRYRANIMFQALPYGGPGYYTFGFECEEAVGLWQFELKLTDVEHI